MRRILLCGALLGALAIGLISCNAELLADASSSTASNAATSTPAPGQTNGKPSDFVTDKPATTSAAPKEGSCQTIPQDRAKAEMDALTAEGKPFVLLDVRRADEYAASHIAGAMLLPNEEIGTERPAALPDLSIPIYVYCRSGNRSLQAAKKLAAMGYTVYDFGGILDWQYETVAGD
ncbi:MAG: rhodanese-like domain-containing protein [Eubacteriales bacterium]